LLLQLCLQRAPQLPLQACVGFTRHFDRMCGSGSFWIPN
jgi:hypothetical protein